MGVLVVALAFVQLCLAAAWLPPVHAWLTNALPGIAHPLWLVLPVATGAMALCTDIRSRAVDPFKLQRIHGTALGLHGSYLALTIADATGIDLNRVDVEAMDGMNTALFYRIMFTLFLPAMLGVFMDGSAAGYARWLRRSAHRVSSMLGEVIVTVVGIAIGAAILAFIKIV